MVTVAALAVRVPDTARLPVTSNDPVVIAPLIERLSTEIPEPVIVLLAPVMFTVPPEACVKDPEPVVARLPRIVMLPEENVTSGAVTVRLLKFCYPVYKLG